MEYEEHQNIRKEDSRLLGITTVVGDQVGPAGTIHKDGSAVKLIAMSNFSKTTPLTFGLPSISALYLDLAAKLHKESFDGMKEDDFIAKYSADPVRFGVKNESQLFDLLEKRIASVIFSYTSLESFANMEIPKDYIYRRTRDDKKRLEEYDKDQIERYISLKEKLTVILPEIYKIKSPKNKKVWHKYTSLEKTRNRLIHIKSQDVRSANFNEDTLWGLIVKEEFPDYPLYALEIIKYYVASKKPPFRWVAKFQMP